MKCSEHRGTPGEGPSLITARQALTLLLVSTRVHQVHTCHTPDVLLDVRLLDIRRRPLRGPGDQQPFTPDGWQIGIHSLPMWAGSYLLTSMTPLGAVPKVVLLAFNVCSWFL